MDISRLPTIVLDGLAGYLNPKDMLHCSMMNSSWRAAFNQNQYWKQFCLRDHKQSLFNCLENRPCLVKPVFIVPVVKGSKLEPLCKWKIHFMRAQHLKRNRQLGRYFVQELNGDIYPFTNEILGSNGDMFYYRKEDEATIVNVAYSPFIHTTLTIPFSDVEIKLCQLVDNKLLVLVQNNMLQVPTLSGNEFVLKYRRWYDNPEFKSEDIPDTNYINKECDHKLSRLHVRNYVFNVCKVFNKTFVGVLSKGGCGRVWLHVWDVNSGRKKNVILLWRIPEYRLDEVYCYLHDFGHGKVLIDLQYHIIRPEVSNIFIYDLASHDVVSIFNFEPLDSVLDCGLAIVCENPEEDAVLKFYDMSLSSPKLRKNVPFKMPHSCVSYHDPYFLYTTSLYTEERYGMQVTVLNTKTMENVSSFYIESPTPKWYFELLYDNLILVYKSVPDTDDVNGEVIDTAEVWKGDTMLYSLMQLGSYSSYLNIESMHYTKLCFHISGYGVCILNFW